MNTNPPSEAKIFFFDLLFPRRCLGCAELLSDYSAAQLCRPCWKQLEFKGDFACAFCSAPVVLGKTCPFCRRDGRQLDRLLVAADYNEPLVEKSLKAFKYKFVRSLGEDIAHWLCSYLEKNNLLVRVFAEDIPLLVPVPLHRRRLNWRGCNQSALLAESIAKYFNWPLQTDLLKRSRNQPPQAEIKNRLERVQRMQGMFSCTSSAAVTNKTVLLLDDVSTTGSTLEDCARALKGAGAKAVVALVLARNR